MVGALVELLVTVTAVDVPESDVVSFEEPDGASVVTAPGPAYGV